MLRARRDTQIPLRFRESSPSQFSSIKKQPKRPRIDPPNVDRNDVGLALAVIVPAPECRDEPPTLIPTELPQFKANYVENRAGQSQYSNLS
jgi:hypothetical protein